MISIDRKHLKNKAVLRLLGFQGECSECSQNQYKTIQTLALYIPFHSHLFLRPSCTVLTIKWGVGKEESKLSLYGGISYGPKAKTDLHATPQLENCAKFDQLIWLISNEHKTDSNSTTLYIHFFI